LTDRVKFVGWASRSEIPRHYGWADAFVLPSLEEGMSNVVLEALAAGLPVVTTDIYGNRDLIQSGSNGVLVPPADAGALAEAIDLLAESSALVRTLGEGSRASALERCWENVAEQYYRVLLAAKGHQRDTLPFISTALPGAVD
jgi:glycosyltransferase involved in cell wall biosynthesis